MSLKLARAVVPLVLLVLLFGSAPAASAPGSQVVVAQEGNNQDQGEGDGGGAAEEEAGPPWTYQMARIGIAILAVLAVAVGLAYWRLVVKRQRAGI
jgi:hypothetical protein